MFQLVSLAILFSAVKGSDVVLGIVGKTAFIECQLPVSSTLAWQTMDGYIIAVDGKVTNDNSSKYVIEKHGTLRESLVVRELTLADDTSYKCFDLNNANMYDVTKLNILALPPMMNITSPQSVLLEGTSVNFSCEADGGKPLPEIDWFIKYANGTVRQMFGDVVDKAYLNGTGHRVSILTVEVTRDLYKASLTCNISVSVLFEKTFTIDTNVLLAPRQPVISGYDGSFDENSFLSLVCSSNGSLPTASVFWLIDGNKLGDAEVVVKPEQNGTFLVKSLFSRVMSREYNGSVLTCAVTNKVLQDRHIPPLTTNITLIASYKPNVIREHEVYKVEQHGNVTLSCKVQGNPTPTLDQLYWTQKGTVIDRKYYKLSNDSDMFNLVLNNIDTSNAGNFSCHAKNRLGAATSDPIELQVLYVPFCKSDIVMKHAVWMGKSIELTCNMEAEPNGILFTWRYETTEEIIIANETKNNASKDHNVFGTLDLTIRSQSQYRTIECFGRNSEGMSVKPCRFNIVPPGPPEAPNNCSIESDNVHVNVKCNEGFNGGSTQQFVLQKLGHSQYETVLTKNEPSFTFDSYQNVTIRVCAFNDDYKLSQICGIPSFVVIDVPELPQEDEVKGSDSHMTAYIAGGVVASFGVMLIGIIIVVLILRRYKKCHSFGRENDRISPNKVSRKNTLGEWWKQNISRRFVTKEITNPPRSVTPRVRGSEAVTDIDVESNDVPYQDIVELASKPRHTLNYNNLVSTPRPTFSTYRTRPISSCVVLNSTVDVDNDIETGNAKQTPDILSESTCFALSPIQNETSIRYLDEVIETHSVVNTVDYETKDEEFSNCYNTNDILEGLSDTEDSNVIPYASDCAKSKALTKTLDKDYSCGDIVDALDEIFVKVESENNEQKVTDTKPKNEDLICGRRMSSLDETEDIDESVTILKFRNKLGNPENTGEISEYSCDEASCHNSNTDSEPQSNAFDISDEDNTNVSATILRYAKSSVNASASMFNNVSASTTYPEDKPVLLRSPLRLSLEKHQSKAVRCLEKSYSLPYRSKKHMKQSMARRSSTSDKTEEKPLQSSDITELQTWRLINSHSSDMFHSDNTSYATAPEASNGSKSDTDSTLSIDTQPSVTISDKDDFSLTLASERDNVTNMNTSKPSAMSVLTDTSDAICDIDEFTLTISEPGHGYEETGLNFTNRSSVSAVTDASLRDIDEFTLTITSEPSTMHGSKENLGGDDESMEVLKLMNSTRSFEDPLECDRSVTQPSDIRRRGSFLEAVTNNSAFESDEASLQHKDNVNFDTETENLYFNFGFEMDSESTLDDEDTHQSDVEKDVSCSVNINEDDLNESEDSTGVVLYI